MVSLVNSESPLDFQLFQHLYNQGLIQAVISKPLGKSTYDYLNARLSPEGEIKLRESQSA